MKKLLFCIPVSLLFLLASNLSSSTPKIITLNSQRDFERGEPKGVSINSFGEIGLAPVIKEIFSAELPFIWTLTADKKGNVYAAGGNQGKVFQITSNNKARQIFQAEETQIYALSYKDNNLFVATSPKGKIYKVALDGKLEPEGAVFFEPSSVYIWSLVFDKKGNLFLATGEPGKIYKVDQSGKGEVFYESNDIHIRTIVFDKNGNLLVGTSDKGKVLRIDQDGKPFVLHDSQLTEVTSIRQDGFGNIYAAVAGDALTRVLPTETKPAGTSRNRENGTEASDEHEDLDLPVQNIPAGRARRGAARGSQIFRIDKDGLVRTLWSTSRERIYTMAVDARGGLLVGTGDDGRLYRVSDAGEHILLSQLENMQITEISNGLNKSTYIATSNHGKIYHINSDLSSQGEFFSEVVDAEVPSRWGSISWEADIPANTQLSFYSRAGNTQEPDKTWSAWSEAYSVSSGQIISSPPARFIQIKAELSSKDRRNSPVLKSVSFSYLQKNVEPQVTEIILHEPGDYYPDSNNKTSGDDDFDNRNSSGRNGFQNQSLGRKTYKKGFRSVSWRTEDENDDQLSFVISYRAENEDRWKPMAENFRGHVYSWDSELFPDGRYFIKVAASDAPSNPPAMALTTEKVSQPFIVDNTGPKVSNLQVQKKGGETVLTFTVEDEFVSVLMAEYGLNADEWQLVYPVDGICDSKLEHFEIKLPSTIRGRNSVVIKVHDALRNVGFGKAHFQM